MIERKARPSYKAIIKKSAKVLLVAEAILFGLTYAGWYRLNTNRDFRFYIRENYPSILESYYQLGETFSGDQTIRNYDETIWQQERNKPQLKS